MSRASALARGRAAALFSMVDLCTIKTPTGETTDPFSGEVVSTYSDTYSGPCRVQQASAQARQEDTGEAFVLLQRVEIQLPLSVLGLQVDDLITITSSRDTDLVGREFRVRELAYKTDATARRVQVEERTS